MAGKFDSIISQMAPLLDELKNDNDGKLRNRNQLQNIPKKGIYVFYEKGKPIYVGRSNRMKDRILEHGRKSSGHGSATFAFNLAQEKTGFKSGHESDKGREQIQKDPEFTPTFDTQKERVSQMKVQVVGIEDQFVQTIFEVYAVLALCTTHYNYFNNH